MRPLTIITGIVMGSAVSISLGLVVVLIIFFFTGTELPRIQDELVPVTASLGWFAALAGASVVGFIGVLREYRWSWRAQLAMWGCVDAVGWRFRQ